MFQAKVPFMPVCKKVFPIRKVPKFPSPKTTPNFKPLRTSSPASGQSLMNTFKENAEASALKTKSFNVIAAI